MDYIVGLTEQELEFYFNKSTGLSNWSELDEMDRTQVILNTAVLIREMMHKTARLEERKNYGIAAWTRLDARSQA